MGRVWQQYAKGMGTAIDTCRFNVMLNQIHFII